MPVPLCQFQYANFRYAGFSMPVSVCRFHFDSFTMTVCIRPVKTFQCGSLPGRSGRHTVTSKDAAALQVLCGPFVRFDICPIEGMAVFLLRFAARQAWRWLLGCTPPGKLSDLSLGKFLFAAQKAYVHAKTRKETANLCFCVYRTILGLIFVVFLV